MDPAPNVLERRVSQPRLPIDERSALLVAVAAAIATLPSGARPTGWSSWDLVLTALAVACITWASAAASWRAVTSFAVLATMLAFAPVPAIFGALAVALAFVVGVRGQDSVGIGALATGIALNVALWSGIDQPLGLVPALVVPAAVALGIHGVRRRDPLVRRLVRSVTWSVIAAAGVSVGFLAAVGFAARSHVVEGYASARHGIAELELGEYELAAVRLQASADRFEQAERLLSSLWTRPAQLLPVVGQHGRAMSRLSSEAARGVREVGEALSEVEPDALRMAGGRLDLAAIAQIEEPLRRVEVAVDLLAVALADLDSVWLAGPLRQRLDDLGQDLISNGEHLQTALDAVRLAPQLLGSEGERRYLIMFTTPVVARGIGGLAGNYAEITALDGQVSLSAFGRLSDLDDAAVENRARCDDCPTRFLERFGHLDFTSGPDGGVGPEPWKNITVSPDYPEIAAVAQTLYEQSGGSRVDGVALMDVYVIEQFVRYTGPVEIPDIDATVTADDVLAFLLLEQYLDEDNAARIDALEAVGHAVISRLLTQSLPAPPVLARDLGPLVAERRLLFWTDRAHEQDLLRAVGLVGDVPSLDPGVPAGFSVSINNAGSNKIDAFLEVRVDAKLVADSDGRDDRATTEVDSDIDPSLGADGLIIEVTLLNTAPDGGLTRSLIGNPLGLPEGTNRMIATFYGPSELLSATRDGEVLELEQRREFGWFTGSATLELPPASATHIRLTYRLAGPVSDTDDLVSWEQPLVRRRSDLGPLAPVGG